MNEDKEAGYEKIDRRFVSALLELPCVAVPGKAELRDESGTLALFAGETAEDSAFNKEERSSTKATNF